MFTISYYLVHDLLGGLLLCQGLLQAFVLGLHVGELAVQVLNLTHVGADDGLRTVPAALLELVGEADRCGQKALAATLAHLAVKLVAHEGTADVEVEVPCRAEAEGVQDTEAGGDVGMRGAVGGLDHAETAVGDAVPDALLVVPEKQVREVEQRVEVEVVEVDVPRAFR